jgi:hypothetical protein
MQHVCSRDYIEDYIKTVARRIEVEGVDCVHLAQDSKKHYLVGKYIPNYMTLLLFVEIKN